MIPQIIILPLIVTQVLSAPSGCTESCNFFVKSHRTQTSGNIQNHGDLTQSATSLQSLNYARPGTWTEHNDYNVDNGHGKVHEELGQVVEGPKTVRYYKKNYTSSYSTGYSNGEGLSELGHQNNNYNRGAHDYVDSQRTYNQIGASESTAQQQRYNTIQDQQHMQSSIRRTNTQSERLEDFGEYSGNSQTVQGISDSNTQFSPEAYPASTSPGNWSKVDSYKTDGGRGRVFQEEGQYVSGPKKVRYYKRNYTSGYTSSNGFLVPEATVVGAHDLHKEIEKIHKEIGKEFNQISTAGNIASSNIAQTNTNTYGLSSDNLHSLNSNTYGDRMNHRSNYHRNEEQYRADTASEYVPHTNPSQNTYSSNRFSMYERHEGRVANLQPTGQFINPTSGYTNVLNTGNSGYSSSVHGGRTTQHGTHNLDQAELLDRYQSQHVQNQMANDNLNRNIYSQNSGMHSDTPGRVTHYREHWHSDHARETSVPQHSRDISQISEQSARYNTHQYGNQHSTQQTTQDSSYMQQYGQNSYNSEHQKGSGMLTTGTLDLGQGHDTVDCAYGTEEHTHHSSSRYHRKYKRSINQDKLSHMQQHGDSDEFTQQTSGNLQFEQEPRYFYDPLEQHASDQHSEDLTQGTEDFGDFTQQTSGNLQFGQKPHFFYDPLGQHASDPHSEDLTQGTEDFDDFTQQTTGKLEFGRQTQQSYQPQKPSTNGQHLEDLTQQTGDFDDFTQQTTGKLEFGQQMQHSYQPQKPGTSGQHLEDLTQQTGDSDDLTQQTSGKVQFGNQLQPQSQKPGSNNQHLEDLIQQTGDFDDLTQQTSGKLQFGNQQQSQKPQSHDQYSEDLTQQTGDFDDLTQQTSGKLEFGQQSQHTYQPQKPRTSSQQIEDLTQQTGEFDDLTQQTSGKLEFGSQLQQQSQKPQSHNQYSEDLTQQTGDFDDLTQQTSGKLEFGSQLQQQSQKPQSHNQYPKDLTQQTGDFDDLTQQTSGKLEFGQQSQHTYQPEKPRTDSQHLEDLTQQTGDFDDLTQQTSGHLEFGSQSQHSGKPQRPGSHAPHIEDMTQQTGSFDDLTQQTSGNLEFGSQLQQQSQRPQSHNQYTEDLTQQTGDFDDFTQQTSGNQHMDLTQQTGEFDDLTQQTSGKLEFGQQTQHYNLPQKPRTSNQHLEDLTQQTGEFDDLTQQTSGKLEFGSQSRYPYQTQKPRSYNQYSEHTTQQTENLEDLTQQTSGNLEFGQQTQYPYQFQKPGSSNQHLGDLTQQSGGFDDLTQQTSGGSEFRQHSYQPQKPGTGNQYSEDLTQVTGNFDDLAQQTSGQIEFGQQSQNSYHPQKPSNQYADDLTQQIGTFDDLAQQTSGKINFGQMGQQRNEDFTAQQHGSVMQLPKPAEKPKPRARYSRRGSLNNLHTQNPSTPNTVTQENLHNGVGDISIQSNHELPPKVLPESEIGNIRRENIRGDQGSENATSKDVKYLEDFALGLEGGNEDQNRLHKSNDATVGMQWHYTYHPSDRRHFVQQADQKEKDELQQQTGRPDLSGLHLDEQHALEDLYQQSSNRYNENSELEQESQKYGYMRETEFGQKMSDDTQKQDQLSQQTTDETQDQLVQTTEIKQMLEPRILEAYGGGPYDASHSEDIYDGLTINPSATLPPIDGADPWDIREKPREMNVMPSEVTPPPMPVEPLTTETEETTPLPSFWSRVGNKITNTFGKAKEKARTIFG